MLTTLSIRAVQARTESLKCTHPLSLFLSFSQRRQRKLEKQLDVLLVDLEGVEQIVDEAASPNGLCARLRRLLHVTYEQYDRRVPLAIKAGDTSRAVGAGSDVDSMDNEELVFRPPASL